MRTINSFQFITLNGFFKGSNEDIHWHSHGEEQEEFSQQSLRLGNTLLFGRKTYEILAEFWSSPMAEKIYPEVAEGLHKAQKIVFSNTLKEAKWNNSSVMNGDIVAEIKKLKQTEGSNLSILGSGSIVSQFSEARLIDQYEIMIDPVAIGQGTPLFNGMKSQLNLQLKTTKVFKNGVVLLTYAPA